MSNDVTVRSVVYEINGQAFESRLVYSASASQPRPGLVMAPNWMGISQGAEDIARQVAAQGYVVLLADLYGQGVRPANAEEAGQAMTRVKDDRAVLRKRMQAALKQLLAQKDVSLDATRIATFGFCFGGCAALELARSGADVEATITFHGTLDTNTPQDAHNIQGAVLVLHGGSDPMVPADQLRDFKREMDEAGVDWQLNVYGEAVHSFTDPEADVPGRMMYDPRVSERAFKAMYNLLDEVFVDAPTV